MLSATLVIAKDTNNISYTVRYVFLRGTRRQNMRPNRLSHLYIEVLYEYCAIVNATIGFSENLFSSCFIYFFLKLGELK